MAFNDEKICGTVKTFIPAFQNNAGSLLRGDDGRDLCIGAFHICRHIHRKSGTGDDDICTCVGGGSHIIFIIAGGDHNVESHQSRTAAIHISCDGSCLFQFLSHGAQVGGFGIFCKIRFLKSNLCGGDDADSTGFCHGTCQSGQADANAHATLNQWQSCNFISNL